MSVLNMLLQLYLPRNCREIWRFGALAITKTNSLVYNMTDGMQQGKQTSQLQSQPVDLVYSPVCSITVVLLFTLCLSKLARK